VTEPQPVLAFPNPTRLQKELQLPGLSWGQLRIALKDMTATRIRQYGVRFLNAGDPGKALMLLKKAASEGDSWAALAIGAMYDPLIFNEDKAGQRRTPFSKANPAMARCWYRVARSLGESQADSRIKLLDSRSTASAVVDPAPSSKAGAICTQLIRRYGAQQMK